MYLRDMSTPNSLVDLFFDLDRTLWDFDRNSREALEEIFIEIAQPNLPQPKTAGEFITVYEAENEKCWKAYREGRITKELLRPLRFRKAMERLGFPAFEGMEALAEAMGTAYVQRAPYRTALFDGAIEVCQALKTRGHRMFILTNGFEEVQHIKVSRSGLEPFFDGVFTSDALGFKKPDPKCFTKCLVLADSSADRAVMIGDDWECDVQGALEAGLGAIHFDPYQRESLSSVTRRISTLRTLLELDFNQR
ncbi:MAG: noncanonical pyrimidine nucleotidase, YjjG family [Crocinitomicaceae bacterium]|nr:noncanonical pyrimidine nucleotidase, YjjG family [Crocinitomicaceae bacterium]